VDFIGVVEGDGYAIVQVRKVDAFLGQHALQHDLWSNQLHSMRRSVLR
jgi:hypothetical protein